MLKRFWNDTSGIILPYVTLMMAVFVGIGALALDGARSLSLQTQMQAAADALALTGARELNQGSTARSRATLAISNLVSNGISGMGTVPALTVSTPVFYSALPSAATGFTGTPATSDAEAKFVAVTVTPVTVPTIFPIGTKSFTAGASAIAGQTAKTACNVSNVFICNPYETSGMTDAQATQALNTALDTTSPSFNPATLRKLYRLTDTKTGPGHFGWTQPADQCNGTSCLKEWVARDTKVLLSRSCYTSDGVKLATGNKPLADYFNDRFDIYSGLGPSSSYSPSINVRKGYIPATTGSNKICNPSPGDYLAAQKLATTRTVSLATVGAIDATATKNSANLTLANTTGIEVGMSITKGDGSALGNSTLGISATQTVKAIVDGTTITLDSKVSLSSNTPVSDSVKFVWLTSPLPLDKQWTGLCSDGACLQGNADWDCANYWATNHTSAPPSGCTSINPSLSRYEIYTLENSSANNAPASAPISDYSGYPRGTTTNGETGSPMCAIGSNGYTPSWDADYDPRILYVTAINCLAQSSALQGGNSGGLVPAANFLQFFLTQPFNADGQNYLYGEFSGLMTLKNGIKFQQVQLYR